MCQMSPQISSIVPIESQPNEHSILGQLHGWQWCFFGTYRISCAQVLVAHLQKTQPHPEEHGNELVL
nr:hypothetical protein Iba_chr08cCG0660 [Ipomoea batatas]